MLKILDTLDPTKLFDYRLVDVDHNTWTYSLSCTQMEGHIVKFKLPYNFESFQDGYSVSVHLMKNQYMPARSVFELRSPQVGEGSMGRFGYIVQLSSIFDPSVLSVNKFLFSYFYYALGNIFFNDDFKQTKTPTLEHDEFEIFDFFDQDTLFLMTCDQITQKIPDYQIENYIPDLYRYGFYFLDIDLNSKFSNQSPTINLNFLNLFTNSNLYGYHPYTPKRISENLQNEEFILNLFRRKILGKMDFETKFILLYQIIELLILRVLKKELLNNICANANSADPIKIKEEISTISTEKERIKKLFNQYSSISQVTKNDMSSSLHILLQYVGFPEYSGQIDPNAECSKIFYDYRNRLFHNHRAFSDPKIDEKLVYIKMEIAMSAIELFIIELVMTYQE